MPETLSERLHALPHDWASLETESPIFAALVGVALATEAVKVSRSVWRQHDESCPSIEDATAQCYCGARFKTQEDRMGLEHKMFAALDALDATLKGDAT